MNEEEHYVHIYTGQEEACSQWQLLAEEHEWDFSLCLHRGDFERVDFGIEEDLF